MKTSVKCKISIRSASAIMIFILLLVFISSCSQNTKGTLEEFYEQESINPSKFELGSFGYLEEVMGCSCYLSSDSLHFSNQEFIYAEKYGLPDGTGYGFIMLDENLIRLEVLNYDNDPEGKFRKVRLGNETLEVWLNFEMNKSQDPEVLPVTGKIQIYKKDQHVLSEDIVGICGC